MTIQTSQSALIKKVASIIFFLTVFYVLPLSKKPELLLNWQIILLACICSILFATQPRLSISESKEKKPTDRNTIWLIIIVSGIGQIVSLIEWAYFSKATFKTETIFKTDITNHILPLGVDIPENYFVPQNGLPFLIIAGSILLLTGTIFRLYAISVLGKYFSATVQIKDGHRIIKAGPYKLLRHPSYTGAYIVMRGSAVFLHSIIGILVFGIGMLLIYHLRIKTEEKTLIQNFGKEYLDYSRRTWKMFPFVW